MRFEVDASDITNFVSRMQNWPTHLETVQVSALNEVGDGVARQVVNTIADHTGLMYESASRFVQTTPATVASRTYEIRVRQAMIEGEMTSREGLPRRDWLTRDNDTFNSDMVFTVVTAKDDKVCLICQEIAENGPYTIEELNALRSEHPHFLTRELNCRCATTPFRPERRLPVRMRETGGELVDTKETLRQLAEKIIENVRTTIVMK
jgi:hypothetical protein